MAFSLLGTCRASAVNAVGFPSGTDFSRFADGGAGKVGSDGGSNDRARCVAVPDRACHDARPLPGAVDLAEWRQDAPPSRRHQGGEDVEPRRAGWGLCFRRRDPATNTLVKDPQARILRAFLNLKLIAESEGASLQDCVRLTVI